MCEWGDSEDVDVVVPTHLSSTGEDKPRVFPVDRCMAPLVRALNAAGFATAGCCCGHGLVPAQVVFADGTTITALAAAERVKR